MNGRLLCRLLNLRAEHSLYREDGKWYHHLRSFPGILFDRSGYLVFDNVQDYSAHPALLHQTRLHVPGGISALPGYSPFSPDQLESLEKYFKADSEETIRVLREISLILRNQALVRKLKKVYQNQCQICGTRLSLGGDVFYSEVHHIIPLGAPYNGPDKTKNMVCVCPNHHILLDLKVIELQPGELLFSKHQLSEESVKFHNLLVRARNQTKDFRAKKRQNA